MLTSIGTPRPGFYQNGINMFCSESLALFTLTSIQNIWKSTKTETPKQQDERQLTKDSKLCKAQTGHKKRKSSWYIKKFQEKEKEGVQEKKLIDT